MSFEFAQALTSAALGSGSVSRYRTTHWNQVTLFSYQDPCYDSGDGFLPPIYGLAISRFKTGTHPSLLTRGQPSRMISYGEIETFTAKRKRLGWRLHAILLLYGAITAFVVLYLAPNYFYAIGAWSLAIGLTLLRFWAFSRRGWFWMTMMVMAIVQVPLIGTFRDFAARWKWAYGFGYGLAACIAMDYVVRWIAPDSRRKF
jgi:hypothetical protein